MLRQCPDAGGSKQFSRRLTRRKMLKLEVNKFNHSHLHSDITPRQMRAHPRTKRATSAHIRAGCAQKRARCDHMRAKCEQNPEPKDNYRYPQPNRSVNGQ